MNDYECDSSWWKNKWLNDRNQICNLNAKHEYGDEDKIKIWFFCHISNV